MEKTNTLATGWGFPPEFHKNGKTVSLVSSEQDIKEALEILFSTAIYERFNYPDFGCDLKKYMFEPVDRQLVIEIRKTVWEAIYKYEQRIQVRNIEVSEADENAHLLLINIDYLIKALNKMDSIVYTLSIF